MLVTYMSHHFKGEWIIRINKDKVTMKMVFLSAFDYLKSILIVLFDDSKFNKD